MSLSLELRGKCRRSCWAHLRTLSSACWPQWLRQSCPLSLLNSPGSLRPLSNSLPQQLESWVRWPRYSPSGTQEDVRHALQSLRLPGDQKKSLDANTPSAKKGLVEGSHLSQPSGSHQGQNVRNQYTPRLQQKIGNDATQELQRLERGQEHPGPADPGNEICNLGRDGGTSTIKTGTAEEGGDGKRSIIRYQKKAVSVRRRSTLPPRRVATPSETLLYSLGPLSRLYAVTNSFKTKVDLSRIDPMALAMHGRKGAQHKVQSPSSLQSVQPVSSAARLSLQRLLAEYLHACWPLDSPTSDRDGGPQVKVANADALHVVLSEQNVNYIRQQGYQPEDLVSWAWVLTASTIEWAVERLLVLMADSSDTLRHSRCVPTFVFLFLLRREKWSARALSKVIIHAWARLEGAVQDQGRQPGISIESENRQGHLPSSDILLKPMLEHTVVVMVIRLLRQARKVWPEACIPIAAMFTQHVNGNRFGSPTATRKTPPAARLTFVYNTMLSLIALPASVSPYRSVAAQRRAQFSIVARMRRFDPPLVIDRRAYRAMTRTHLAHKKTSQERDWASLKGKDWPPWKEDKIGLDAEKGHEYGMSLANQVRKRAEEAGYACQPWEVAAEILAGWDTDRSPTIQKRILLPRSVEQMSRPLPKPMDDMPKVSPGMNIWAARIEATR